MPRDDVTYEDLAAAPWLRGVVLPLLFFVTAVAIICGLVLSGAVQGDKTYEPPEKAPTTQPTVVIEP